MFAFIGLGGMVLLIVGVVMLIFAVFKKNDGLKKKALISAGCGLAMFVGALALDPTPAKPTPAKPEEKAVAKVEEKAEKKEEAKPVVKAEKKVEAPKEVPHRKNAKGISNKDIKDLNVDFKGAIKNDVTGKWKLATTDKANFDFNEYAVSYAKKYMKDGEIHYFVSYGNKAVHSINKMGGILLINATEYKVGEEHDAKKIGGGMSLGSATVYMDNGDIEK